MKIDDSSFVLNADQDISNQTHNDIEYSIIAKNLHFSYYDKLIINNLSIKIPQGSFVSIMGGSGCGKTTLLKMLSRQILPDSGEIYILNKNILSLNENEMLDFRKNLGFLFQFGALFTDMNVEENVGFMLHQHTKYTKEEIVSLVKQKLNDVNLPNIEKLMPYELSGGMARRVALARSNILNQKIIIYDEPFTGLDPVNSLLIAKLIKNLNQQFKQTTIVATHDIKIAFEFSDLICFIDNGRIIGFDKPSNFIQHINTDLQHSKINQFIEWWIK